MDDQIYDSDKVYFEYSLCGIYTFPKTSSDGMEIEESQSVEVDKEFLEFLTTLQQGSDSSSNFAWQRKIYVKKPTLDDVSLDMTAKSKKYTTIHVRIFSKPDNLSGICCVSQYLPSDNTSPHIGVTKKEIISSISIIRVLESFGYKLFSSYYETGQLFMFYLGRREEVFVYVTKQNAKNFEQYSLSKDKLLIKVKGSTIGGKSNDSLYSRVNTIVNSIKK